MRAAIAAVLLAACSSAPAEPTTPKAKKAPPAPTAEAICADGDPYACFEARRAECTADTRVWRVRETILGGLMSRETHIAENGLIRRDWVGKVHMAARADDWMACVDECVDGAPACIPFSPPAKTLETTMSDDCTTVEETTAEPWRGSPARRYVVDCAGHRHIILLALDHAPLRTTLAAIGLDDLHGLPEDARGYAVRVQLAGDGADDPASLLEVDGIEPSSCDAFAQPPDSATYLEPKHFDHAAERLKPLETDWYAALEQQGSVLGRMQYERRHDGSRKAGIFAVGRACLGDKPDYTMAEINACMKDPEMEKVRSKAVSEYERTEAARAWTERFALGEQLLQSHIVRPLCRELSEL